MYLLLRISLTFWLGVYKGTVYKGTSGSHSASRHLQSIMSTSIEFTTGKRGKENVIADEPSFLPLPGTSLLLCFDFEIVCTN